jgi:hypothetical protein
MLHRAMHRFAQRSCSSAGLLSRGVGSWPGVSTSASSVGLRPHAARSSGGFGQRTFWQVLGRASGLAGLRWHSKQQGCGPASLVACCGLTIRSTRNRFVPAKCGTEKRATFCFHYAVRVNSGVRPLMRDQPQSETVSTGSPPFSRTLTRRPIAADRSVHVEAKEVQCGVQAWCG